MRLLTAYAIVFFLIVTQSFGQIKYEKGYFINRANRRTECLIKNMDWKSNPSEFSYKLEDSSAPEIGYLTFVKEFGIYNYCKFIGADVKIDRSENALNYLNDEKNPVWNEERLFLKVLVEGKAKLYSYDDKSLRKFFYSVQDSAIHQLFFKKYLTHNVELNKSGKAENNSFRQQLWSQVRCENSSMDMVQNLKYTSTDLENYIQFYNRCSGDTITEISNKTKRNFFNLKITPGLNLSSMTISNGSWTSRKTNFDPNVGFRLGLESEIILPFNMNKWGIVFEPTFQYYDAEKSVGDNSASIKFKSIEFPVGLRYYLFLNDRTKFFLNGFYISNFAVNFDTKIEYKYKSEETPLDIASRNSFAYGGGIDFKRLSLEARYYTNRNMSGEYLFWKSNYSRFSVILGFKLIDAKKK